MKKILTVLYVMFSCSLLAQSNTITLKECIESALANKANIQAAKTDVVLTNLKQMETKAKYLPEISLAYDYRFNPLIPSQIIPVGQFNQVPTNDKRAIQFGTNWQQNVGITAYQPIIDLTISSRIKESKINEQLSLTELKIKEYDLKYEVLKTYNQIMVLDYERQAAIRDTMRSFISFRIIGSKFTEGKVLQTELNSALVNHNKNLLSLNKVITAIVNEEIYLSFLTAIPLERLIEERLAGLPDLFFKPFFAQKENIWLDSLPEFQRIGLKEKLVRQQYKTERSKQQPSLGFQGFLGANQYSQTFNPFQTNSWFGNSYVGLSLSFPILSKEKPINSDKQLQEKLRGLSFDMNELQASVLKNLLQEQQQIATVTNEIRISGENYNLLQENLKINQERYLNGKLTALELNLQEAELQKEAIQLNHLKQTLGKANIEWLYNSGRLNERLKTLN